MVTQYKLHRQTLVLLISLVHLCMPVCVDVQSDTEAIVGKAKKLTCISCLKREEVTVTTFVKWLYTPSPTKGKNISYLIYEYNTNNSNVDDNPFKDRLNWNGSKDLQEVSIEIRNVTHNDSGLYTCEIRRVFGFELYTPVFKVNKTINLTVKEKASDDTTAIYSEIMMYVLLVFLTFWLLVEMVYCYRKISKSDEQAQDTATNYLAIPSEQKDNPAAPVTE
ncbi:sodium channel subunit beta-3 isoform X1 [Neolamprologus brichardi]|uniref:Sodium channel regulatory subunit beta-3 n=1 Tax=Neolamprologus brichardi TaxID=32507 RepID=A0A3Q4MGM4_NEOBR|nr:sodium channel subunit beta-3 isoform X1 [Neolamprologus brichardi]XP_006795506.1 sodium channel subunit beta-3 isoform X1 [Neolamprologus brichardi]XP_006795507.1 sodium channel subunit beta-3 isoform X1 [Neolamprologus brichardi]